MRVLICGKEQAFLMASKDYFGDLRNVYSRAIQKDGVYYIPLINSDTENFASFVMKEKSYKKFFSIVEKLDSIVTGFKSCNFAVKAVEFFNKRNTQYYIDSSCEIEEVISFSGWVFIPLLFDAELERIFWDYINHNNAFRNCLITGMEII